MKDRDTLCVACEIDAWRFAIAAAQPTWTRAMHQRLAQSLETYVPYATPAEKIAIRDLEGKLGFCQSRQDRLMSTFGGTQQ